MSIQNREQQRSEPHVGEVAMVFPFAAIDHTSLSIVGGKAANLGELTRAGLPVPPGFCVTTAAYALVAAGADLEALLGELATTRARDTAHLAALATAARAHLLAASVPAAVAEAITEAYQALGGGEPLAVAVRSSATAEDLPFASFAGQQDTYLNIIGLEAVLDAVRRCWASLWTDRAVSYRASKRIDQRTVRLAVVVQRMVEASVAGVLFTANPLTGRRHQAVIDASPGLGEAIVSGIVNPDHFVVTTATGGGTQGIETAERSNEACLTDAQVRALAELGSRVEAHYGAPQDTEWAIDASGHLWLTQARPITTLFPLPAGAPRTDDALRVYFSMNVAQGVYRPLTPMGLSAFRVMGSSIATYLGLPPHDLLAGPSVLTDAASRLFVDVTAVLRTSLGRTLLGRVASVMEARSSLMFRQLEADPRLSLVPVQRWRLVRTGLLLLVRTRAPLSMLQAVFRPAAARGRVRHLETQLRTMGTVPLDASATERLTAVERLFLGETPRVLSRTVPVLLSGLLAFTLAGRLLRGLATGEEQQTVLRGLPYNPTTEMDLSLWTLAKLMQADATSAHVLRNTPLERLAQDYRSRLLPPLLQQGLADFLQVYGHRGVAEIDLGLPRWSEDPTHILGVLANYLQLTDPQQAPDTQFQRGAQEAEAMVAELARRAARKGWLRGRLVKLCLRRERALHGLREMPKFCLILLLASMREALQLVGKELAEVGRLEKAEDIFFITLPEAWAAVAGTDMRSLVRERYGSYEHELTGRHVPRVLLSDGTEPTTETYALGAADDILRGTPASAGSVTAKARVILDPTGARLEPGEILVAPSTDPGWTPLFLVAGGLVMEMGGAMSHGAVVAREYGIPAVVGVPEATERINTGQQITVDGSAGTVSLEEERS